MYKRRQLEDVILKLSKSFPVILVTGPRQTGKTTLFQYLTKKQKNKYNYVSLDEYGPLMLARQDPALFFEQYKIPLIIDEIQYAPQLLQEIKVIVDRSKKNGMFWLTGSQQFHLMHGVSQSLAGRIAILRLLGISQNEEYRNLKDKIAFRPDRPAKNIIKRLNTADKIFHRIVRGTFPRFLHKDAPPIENFYGSYIQTYIERDVRNLQNISNLNAFEKFIKLAAARIGQLLNLSDLARDAQIAVSTAKQWLSVLEAGYLVYLLKPYYRNISKRQIKTAKLYFLDTGLACYLTGWHNPEVAMKGAMAGHLLENYVINEIVKSYWHNGRDAPLYYWRTKEKKEIDLLIEEDGKLFPVEIKMTKQPDNKSIKNIKNMFSIFSETGNASLICLTNERYPISRNINVIPASCL